MTARENPARPFPHRAVWLGVALGAAYGLSARLVLDMSPESAFMIMSMGFIIGVPIAIGFLTVASVPAASHWYAIFMPWMSCLLCIAVTYVTGQEGAICVVFASPIMLITSSLGGLLARQRRLRSAGARVALAVLPLGVAGIETVIPLPDRRVTSVTEITVDAPARVVWPLVVSVDTIRPSERSPALFTRIGFPAPIAATLDRPGVGGIRTASFERGVRFHEVVTDWEPERRLRFTIDVASVPPRALDDHVTIGGPFFDVLDGTYELVPLDSARTLVRLTSTHRVATHFNPYAAFWAERVMSSIQQSILEVLRGRAVRGGAGIGATS